MIRVVLFVTFCCELCCCGNDHVSRFLRKCNDDPDTYRNVSELITSKGYPVEEHEVQTEDGYSLSVQRIPHGRNCDARLYKKRVVLLIHGLHGDAANWVLNFPNQSLGFILADKNCDVWLLNTRGNQYSKKHVNYSASEYKFWNFSFNEIGLYDIPATIHYILNTTGETCLYAIGHSQGTSAMFSMLTQRQDMNHKVRLFCALAPATYIGHMTSAVRILVPIAPELAIANDLVFNGEFFPDSMMSKVMRAKFCGTVGTEICTAIIFASGGIDGEQLNKTRLGVYAGHFPTSASTKCLIHYAQMINSQKFRKYDYGPCLNMEYYHQEEPPDYNLSSITTPVALFWGTEDKLADPTDVSILRKELKSLVYDHCVPYNHFDFVLAKNAYSALYVHILQLLLRY